MRGIICFMLFIVGLQPGFAQQPNWMWAKSSDAGNSYWHGIVTDSDGNTITSGSFEGSFSYGGQTVISRGGTDVFILKCDGNGTLLWLKQFGGTGAEIHTGGIAIDSLEMIYLTGSFEGSANYDSDTLTSNGFSDIFLVKLDSQGDLQWKKRAGGINPDWGIACTVGENGELYVTGQFGVDPSVPPVQTEGEFDGTTILSNGGADVFLAKYDLNGNLNWVKPCGSVKSDLSSGVVIDDSGNVMISGAFNGSQMQFDNYQLPNISVGSTISSAFVAKFDGAGTFSWANTLGSVNTGGIGFNSRVTSGEIQIDENNNSYIAGFFTGNLKTISQTVNTHGDMDMYLVSYDPQGNQRWVQAIGGGGFEDGLGILYDKKQSALLLTGTYNGDAAIGGDTLAMVNGTDIFVASLDQAGVLNWAISAGGTGHDLSNAIAIDKDDNIVITGDFGSSVCNFGGVSQSATAANTFFMAKLSKPVSVQGFQNPQRLLEVFPNPSVGSFTIESVGPDDRISILTYSGQEIPFNYYRSGDKFIVTDLPKGLFLVQLFSNKQVYRTKLVVY